MDKCRKALNKIVELSNLSDHKAGILRTTYIKINGFATDQQAPGMDGIPPATITGSTPKVKLQNIHNRAMLFHWHIDTVTKYMTDLLEVSDNETQILLRLLKDSMNRLQNLSGCIEKLLQILDPNTTTMSIKTCSRDEYEKKIYGWAVLDRHKDFLAMVLEVAGFMVNTVCEG
ncbi:unnamed protein product [Coregonus sp. 'balchen']|nr:unnamed protein product [Coregonus sp. 'balchen']